jgi:uncharacterized protein (TIGR03083 family)
MGDEYEVRLAVIDQLWQQWASLGDRLSPAEWTTPSRCPGWDVAALFAHVSIFPVSVLGPPPDPRDDSTSGSPDGPTGGVLSAVDILRGYNQPGGIAHTAAGIVADGAARDAAAHTQPELTARFAVVAPQAVQRLRGIDPAVLVPWPGTGGVAPIVECLRIVVLESVVHLLDVLRALDLPTEIPEPALRETVGVLAEIASPVEFIEAATGRSHHQPLPVLR